MDVNIFKEFSMALQTQHEDKNLIHASQDPSDIVVVTYNDTTYFVARPPVNKVYRHSLEKDEFFLELSVLLQRFTPETDAWFANHCQDNRMLNALVDTAITYLKQNEEILKPNQKPPLVIFDIDETVLTLYTAFKTYFTSLPYSSEIVSRLPVFGDMIIDQLTIVRPIQRLYQFLVSHGVSMAFVTGRPETVKTRFISERQVRAIGYTQAIGLFMCPSKWEGTVATWKEHARQELSQSFQIVMTIDDDCNNLQGGHLGACALWVPSILDQWKEEDTFFATLLQAKKISESTIRPATQLQDELF